MSDYETLRKNHRAHLEAAAKEGKPGRACTAPAVTSEHLNRYQPLVDSLEGFTRVAAQMLSRIVEGKESPPGIEELNKLDSLLDSIPPGEARDAVFHLFWHAKELALGRKPV